MDILFHFPGLDLLYFHPHLSRLIYWKCCILIQWLRTLNETWPRLSNSNCPKLNKLKFKFNRNNLRDSSYRMMDQIRFNSIEIPFLQNTSHPRRQISARYEAFNLKHRLSCTVVSQSQGRNSRHWWPSIFNFSISNKNVFKRFLISWMRFIKTETSTSGQIVNECQWWEHTTVSEKGTGTTARFLWIKNRNQKSISDFKTTISAQGTIG